MFCYEHKELQCIKSWNAFEHTFLLFRRIPKVNRNPILCRREMSGLGGYEDGVK